jgi:NADH-quinone oxidoreductase subunit M
MNLLLLVLLSPAVATLVLFGVPAGRDRLVRGIATLATAVSLCAAILAFVGFDEAPASFTANAGRADAHEYRYGLEVPWVEDLGIAFRLGADGMGLAMTLLTALIIFTGVMVSYGIKKRVKEYYICLLALVTGVFGVFSSLDLFFYYFFYELAVIPMYLLIGVWGSTTRTVDQRYATMKLVLMLSTGAVMALLGLLAVYEAGGVGFDMVRLEETVFSSSFQHVWFPFVFLGFAALVPMWPLHSWSPAGHAAAPAAVSMLHAGVLMKLGAFGVLRVACTYFPEAAVTYLPVVAILCCFNIVYGGLVAVAQRDMKLIIGYSSSSHMGYVLLGIASMTMLGLSGAVFLMFAHGIMTALAFALIGWFYDQTHTRMLDDLGGMMKVMPFVGTCFVIASMASAGLPGFANFVSELTVILGAWEARDVRPFMVVPAVLAVWGLVITGVYLLRAVKDAWFGTLPARWEGLKDAATPVARAPYLVLIATLLLFGFWPQPMLDVVEQGVRPLHARLTAGSAPREARAAVPEPTRAPPADEGR